MDLNSKEVYSSFGEPGKGGIKFYKLYDASDFEHIGSEGARKAWETMVNLRAGLIENKDRLTLDHLLVLRNSLYSRFSELGVPSDMIQPLVESFRYVQDVLNQKAAN